MSVKIMVFCHSNWKFGTQSPFGCGRGLLAARKQERDIRALGAVLAAFPEGASLEQIEAAMELPVSRRTLIRRLADMVERGIAVKSGTSRAARYWPVGGAAMPPRGGPSEPMQPDLFVPLSKA